MIRTPSRRELRSVLLIGVSVASMASALEPTPADAGTAAARMAARVSNPRPQVQAPGGAPVRSGTMRGALERQRATQSRTEQIRAYVLAARDAARATNQPVVTDGLGAGGLDPTDTIREAVAAARAGDTVRANQLLVSAGANFDETGLATWEGAGLPTQSVVDGRVVVTIDQTQERALLSWNSFNVGSNTTLQFNQKSNGVAKPGWVVANRVANSVAPSQILGNVKADGTVLVINQRGIIFGQNAQVNTHSLLASSLELGNMARVADDNPAQTQATTIRERNRTFLENGLFASSADLPGNHGKIRLLVSSLTTGDGYQLGDTLEGDVIVERGAKITSGAGGFLMLTAPRIEAAGTLTATDGQVSLQAGRAVGFLPSSGDDNSIDRYVRGYKLHSFDPNFSTSGGEPRPSTPADGSILVTGLIESRRGYLSLGAGPFGTVEHAGLLSTTTSVSRNGKISITAGNITLKGNANPAAAAGIEMLADAGNETMPQGDAADPADFKASQLEIATQVRINEEPGLGLAATNLTMGTNAVIYAPGANVTIGSERMDPRFPGRIDIAGGAVIDVSGLKNVQLDASRNQIEIKTVKRNELQDTPNYREVALEGNFSLNGATLYIDPRIRGVRDDGVAWIGSPLIEAGSLASQIGATAAEFMTTGGTVNLLTSRPGDLSAVTPGNAPAVRIDKGAVIDFSGGWVTYAAGPVRTSRLITNDGRIVDISKANPNDVYVGVAEGFTEIQPRFGIVRSHFNATGRGSSFNPSYDEGRDAGSLKISAPAVTVDGQFYGNAFAGARQISDARRGSLAVARAGDSRLLQRSPYELPAGGALSIASLGDMLIYRGTRGEAASDLSELLLNDQMLSDAGLSALSLNAAGSVTFAGSNPETLQGPSVLNIAGASSLTLAPGGSLLVEAGRTIRFDGTVEAASGTITARTIYHGPTRTGTASDDVANGSIFRSGLYGEGDGDDLPLDLLYASDPGDISPFDIIVTGKLSTAGLWVNDFREAGTRRGGAFSDGGSITLRTAPRVFMAVGEAMETATQAVDLSGSIRVRGLLDVGAGGYVTPTGGLDLTARGGNISLINETVYASLEVTKRAETEGETSNAHGDHPIGGQNQSVDFTPVPGVPGVLDTVFPALVPEPRSTVEIAEGSLRGFGFAGGGTFTLVAPDISFGSENRPGSTHIGLDFFKSTGFGTLDVSTYRSRIVGDVFANDRTSASAFLETTRFVVGEGETLDLTQWLLPSILTSSEAEALRGLATGASLADQAFLTPFKPDNLWDQRAAHLKLGGLTELDVLAGGQVIGAPEASITATKIYNGGSIVLHGGTLAQDNSGLNKNLLFFGLGVRDTDLGGAGLAEAFGGQADAQGRFDEEAENAAGITDPQDPERVLTNRELVSKEGSDRLIHFLGLVGEGEGMVLADGSVTDLSGIAILDPRAPLSGSGRLRQGRVLDGGTLSTSGQQQVRRVQAANGAAVTTITAGWTLIREDDARLDISGTSAVFDQPTLTGAYAPYREWSKAGTISALSGGTLGNTPIIARGGVEAAEGGTLEWLRPTIGAGEAAIDYLSADVIKDSGFDTVIARGGLTLDGDFSLALRKALLVTSQEWMGVSTDRAESGVTVGATSGTQAHLSAGYIRFASVLPNASFPLEEEGGADVRFTAGSQGFDFVGGIGFDPSIATLTFRTPGDVRLSGVHDPVASAEQRRYDGQLVAAGDMTIDARRTYATTGTGNLQAMLEEPFRDQEKNPQPYWTKPYYLAVVGDHSITFGNSFLDPDAPAPLSAGTHLQVLAPRIVQNGYLAAPLGRLQLGSTEKVALGGSGSALRASPTESITFGPGSVTTVSGAGLDVPYGLVRDKKEYYFPAIGTPINAVPTGQLQLSGDAIEVGEGARIDGRGGGDVFGYEFSEGTGGSRDVLDRISGNHRTANDYDPATKQGYQYPDHRQVFALVPVDQIGKMALYDPLYSADYGAAGPADLYGTHAGRTVRLDAAPGIAAGEYLLLPAKYAMSIPGALRLVENTGANAPPPGAGRALLDGSTIVGGTFGYADTGIAESTRRSFTVQSKDVFLKYSSIATKSGSKTVADQTAKAGKPRPRLPLDAARVILSPLEMLRVAGVFDTRPAEGGEGGQFDILGSDIVIAAEGQDAPEGALLLVDTTLRNLNATSLLIGGQRSEGADGTTVLNVTAHSVDVLGGATLSAPELLLAVGGADSKLTVHDGATLAATGELGTQPASDYAVASGGSLLRLANGAERLVARSGTEGSTIEIGEARLSGKALMLDSSGSFQVSDAAALDAREVAISGQAIRFGQSGDETEAGVIGTGLAAKLAASERLTIRSPGAVRFAAGDYRFNDLVLDTATLATDGAEAVTIRARDVRLTNATGATDGCATAGLCGEGSTFSLETSTLTFGSGAVRTAGFAEGVSLAASQGMYVEGKGSFATGDASLTLGTPFLADRAAVADPREQKVRPDYTFLTNGAFTLVAPAANGTAPAPQGHAAPAARIGIGTKEAPVLSASLVGGMIRSTAGIIDIQSRTDIDLTGATLATPGYEATFGDKVDPVTVSAGGGTINLLSREGNIRLDAATTLVSDSGVGKAGTLNLLAGNGTITLDARINPEAKGSRGGSFAFDSGTGSLDFSQFVARYGQLFGGDVWVRTGAGDINLAAGQTLKAENVTLTADGGAITIAGKIDTSGVDVAGLSADAARKARVNGGDIALWGAGGVTLTATAVLDTHTTGYADTDTRPASAGDVTLGIERADAAIRIEEGAIIDVGARRTQAARARGDTGGRLVPETVTDPATGQQVTVYRYAEPDTGGTVTLRAPVIGAGGDQVAVSAQGEIIGADSIQLEAFRRFDLDAIAESGLYSGVSVAEDGTLVLNMADSSATTGKRNPFTESFILDDGTQSLVHFIQNFTVTAADGSSLEGMRLRPGVELLADGNIKTETQWNLAAASFSPEQLEAAVAAGALVEIEALSQGGERRYAVVPGMEGVLLDRFASFLYRVDGVARGEAPVVTLRAGGDLTIDRSISDGFFTFRDKSDPAYINHQLGGGDRTYSPALRFTCGTATGDCGSIVSYDEAIANNTGSGGRITIALNVDASVGDSAEAMPFVNSPLATTGNGAAGAVDEDGNPIGDPLGFAELFPLLPGEQAMHSSDLRLVAGAGDALSVNPLYVNRAVDADMTVSGSFSYAVSATGTVNFGGPLQFGLNQSSGNTPVNFNIGDTLTLTDPTKGLDQMRDDAFAAVIWGSGSSGLSADARAFAMEYFAGKPYEFTGRATAPTGIEAPLYELVGFLQAFEATYMAGLAGGAPGYDADTTPPILSYGDPSDPGSAAYAHVRSYVRTGDGAISVAASRDIDLRGAPEPEYRSRHNGTLYPGASSDSGQFAGAAVYTAGVRVAPTPISAQIVGTGERVTIRPDSPYLTPKAERADFIPSPKAFTDAAPVLARGGGDVTLSAGQDVLGRRDSWSEVALGEDQSYTDPRTGSTGQGTRDPQAIGQTYQRWRVGDVGEDTEVGLAARYFSSGVGALAGGDVSITAGRDITELTVALTNTITSTRTERGNTMLTFGNGDLSMTAGRDILAGRIDIATGAADIHADRNVAAFGTEFINTSAQVPQHMRVRLSDAMVNVSARGEATLASVSALGVYSGSVENASAAGFFSAAAGFSLTATETARITGISANRHYGRQGSFGQSINPDRFVQVMPPSLEMVSLTGSIDLTGDAQQFLYPSALGLLRLYSEGDISYLSLVMSDADPAQVGGALYAPHNNLLPYRIPYVTANTTDAELRAMHNRRLTHAGNPDPIRIYSNGNIDQAALFLPKQARITAGGHIIDMFFSGQNLARTDVTRIRAGGDITGTIDSNNLPFVRSNNFILGGPGTFIVEAGRDLGPFVTSANITSLVDGNTYTYAGGIRTVGNEYNPWLPAQGADLSVRFGMAAGADYTALRETYLNPANSAQLDGDLFEQVEDAFGNRRPDRSKPIYAPLLAEWLREEAPETFASLFDGQNFPDTEAGNKALAEAAYGRYADLYDAFVQIDPLRQQDFLVNTLYFNELAQPAIPDGPSYQQYIRGYRAIQTLFPAELGYTDNLAVYTTDPSTISEDRPLGVPVRNIVNGQPQQAERVVTGDVDLRLATLQTARGGDVTILGPGGDFIAGSIVRTSEQAARRMTAFRFPVPTEPPALESGNLRGIVGTPFSSVPMGYEGILTLRGGQIRSFTDGSFILNQSRLFSLQNGNITMWSSNGDLNAGQGPRSASNFPPITVRFDMNGLAEVNSAGSVSGAGIGAFKRTPEDPASDVILVAPVGEVDAGDAGVRASGNVMVAAARVANADNFAAGGEISGVPSAAVNASVVTPADAASAIAAQAASAATAANNQGERRSIITVDVLGPARGDGECEDPARTDDPDCR